MLNHSTSYHPVPALEFLLCPCVHSWNRSRSTEIHSYKMTGMEKQQIKDESASDTYKTVYKGCQPLNTLSQWKIHHIWRASGTCCTEGHLRTGLSKIDNTNSPAQTIFVSSILHANDWGNVISSGCKYTDHIGTKAESASYSRNNPELYLSSCGMLL